MSAAGKEEECEMITVLLPHPTEDYRLEHVKQQMNLLGVPEILVYRIDDSTAVALEGTHRLSAAAELCVTPIPRFVDESCAEHRLFEYSGEAAPEFDIPIKELVRIIIQAHKGTDGPSVIFEEVCFVRAEKA